jgi:hypothetical protein
LIENIKEVKIRMENIDLIKFESMFYISTINQSKYDVSQ